MQISEFGVKVIILSTVLSLLPTSPFVGFNNLIAQIPYLNYLNWFIPIPEIIVVMETWLSIVTVYYTLLFIMNYVGILKS